MHRNDAAESSKPMLEPLVWCSVSLSICDLIFFFFFARNPKKSKAVDGWHGGCANRLAGGPSWRHGLVGARPRRTLGSAARRCVVAVFVVSRRAMHQRHPRQRWPRQPHANLSHPAWPAVQMTCSAMLEWIRSGTFGQLAETRRAQWLGRVGPSFLPTRRQGGQPGQAITQPWALTRPPTSLQRIGSRRLPWAVKEKKKSGSPSPSRNWVPKNASCPVQSSLRIVKAFRFSRRGHGDRAIFAHGRCVAWQSGHGCN